MSLYDDYIGILDSSLTFCPMIDEYKQSVIKGSVDSKDSKTYFMEAAKCNPSNKDGIPCAGTQEIINYVAQMKLKVNIIQEKVNFNNFDSSRPVTKQRRPLTNMQLSGYQSIK